MKVSVFFFNSLVPRTSGELQGISMYATFMQNESVSNSDRCSAAGPASFLAQHSIWEPLSQNFWTCWIFIMRLAAE